MRHLSCLVLGTLLLTGGLLAALTAPVMAPTHRAAHPPRPDGLRPRRMGHYAPDVTRPTPPAPHVRRAPRPLMSTTRGAAGPAWRAHNGHTAASLVPRPYWRRYGASIDGTGRIVPGAGRARGHVWITGMRLNGAQAFVWRRHFTRRTVVVDSTEATQHVSRGRASRVLAGGRGPSATTGHLTCALTMAPYRAAILLAAARGARCSHTPVSGAHRQPRQRRHRGHSVKAPFRRGALRPSTARAHVADASRVTAVAALNLRRAPSLAAPVLEVLPPGVSLNVRGYGPRWIAVTAPDGARGYVFGRYVRAVVGASRPADAGAAASKPEQELRAAVAATLRINLHRWPPVVYPSPAYGAPYLRDSFWTAQALGSRRFALDVLATFASAERADGDPPTLFVHAYRIPRYHDDESAAVLLIWAWRNRTLYGVTAPRPALRRALRYLLHRAHGGYLMTPAGSGGSWWDAYRFPTAGTLSYSQGLYAVALRCAQHLGLPLPPRAVADAERAYRALYNPRLGYLPLGTQLPASDPSALTGEFLSLWLFRRPILSDAAVLGTFHHLVPFGTGFKSVVLQSGDPASGTGFPGSPTMGIPGDYQNGASWLLYDALSLGAAGLHGLPGALSRLRARLALEFRHGVILHEYLQTNPSLPYYGAEPPFRDYFSWDTFVLVIDRVLRAHQNGVHAMVRSGMHRRAPFSASSCRASAQALLPAQTLHRAAMMVHCGPPRAESLHSRP